MQSRFSSFAAALLPFFALHAAGCGGSDETTHGTGGGGGASSSSASANGGAGGMGSSSSGPPFMTAAHPPAPQIRNLGGPVLTTPKAIMITYNADKNQA